MRERINRLAKGIVDSERLELTVMPEAVEDTVQAGAITEKELYAADVQGRFMKGLVYSSNMRVRIRDSAFGGNRNHIAYQVDGRDLSRDDVVEGAFYFVTNGGEKKVPYRFQVESGLAGKLLDKLETPADLAALVRADYEQALRLFEYGDFVEAPFMQELSVRALYDGLRGRLNRQNQLEEFLVALRAKEPVELRIEKKTRRYEKSAGLTADVLGVRTNTWGYVQFQVSADGEFLEIPKTTFGNADFQDGVCPVEYRVNPARLHQGKNLGAIRLKTVRDTITLPVEVFAGIDVREGEAGRTQEALMQYLSLRLQYEIGLYEERLLVNQMRQQLERLRGSEGDTLLNCLRHAELCLLEEQKDRAQLALETVKGMLLEDPEAPAEYRYFYQYLQAQCTGERSARDALLDHLLKRVEQELETDPCNTALFLLKKKLEPEQGYPAEELEELRSMFQRGCHSPYLYARAFQIYEKEPELLGKMGDYEVQVMSFAARHDLVSRELALAAAEPAASCKYFRRLYCRLLMKLYGQYPEKELLSAVCCMLIKGDRRTPDYFTWYQKALEARISLTRLYEYYLYSLPYDYPYLLPKEVLLYFSYERSMDDFSRSILYMNIVKYMNPESELYKQYVRDIEQFTMEQLLRSRINRRYVVLYEHMLYKEMIDEKVARVLPSILRSYRIRVKNPNIRYVIVCYAEMEGEDVFPVKDGVAYVPLFSEHPVLLFEDEYGSRYANISYRKLPAMDQKQGKELEERCFEVYPGHPMLRLRECSELAEAGITCAEEFETMERARKELPLHPLFRRRITSRMMEYYGRQLDQEEQEPSLGAEYLFELPLEQLTRQERAAVCEALIRQEYVREAYDIVKTYGWDGIRESRLLKLCTRMILQQLFDEDPPLLFLAYHLFSRGRSDSVVLDYLCEHFNGSTKHMFRVLDQGVREHVELYDMPERLLAQMMFTGETRHMDQVFDWYAAGHKTSDPVVRAYFTMKSADYFLRDIAAGDRVFAYLESAVQSMEARRRIPTIYLLALTRYYSTLKEMDEERRSLCRAMVEQLLEEGRVFPYFRELGKRIPMPESIMDKATVEYRGGKFAKPELEMRILPGEERWHFEELKKVYPGIYVRQEVLFEGETLEYRIYEVGADLGGAGRPERTLAAEGRMGYDGTDAPGGLDGAGAESRFAMLNEMSRAMQDKDEAALKEKMTQYLTDNAMMEELFGLL